MATDDAPCPPCPLTPGLRQALDSPAFGEFLARLAGVESLPPVATARLVASLESHPDDAALAWLCQRLAAILGACPDICALWPVWFVASPGKQGIRFRLELNCMEEGIRRYWTTASAGACPACMAEPAANLALNAARMAGEEIAGGNYAISDWLAWDVFTSPEEVLERLGEKLPGFLALARSLALADALVPATEQAPASLRL